MEFFSFAFGKWDYVLILVVAAMAIPLAYIPHPQWKAFVLTLPLPSTVAILSVGQPVGPTHISGLLLLLLFVHAVRILYLNMHVPILPAIIMSAAGYCTAGIMLARILPDTPAVFWSVCAITLVTATLFYYRFSCGEEPCSRTNLPVWVKAPLVVLLVAALVFMKSALQGFMAFFPMVGVFAAYESRRSLRTLAGHIPIVVLLLVTMTVAVYVFQEYVGLVAALALGWATLAILMPPFLYHALSRCRQNNACTDGYTGRYSDISP